MPGLGRKTIQPLKNIFRLAAGAGTLTPAVALAATGSAAIGVGALSFSAPWVLAGLTTLPALWWLMRSVPPKPQLFDFPAMRILFDLTSEDQEPARMPLWQRILRLTAAGLVITGLAQPQWNTEAPLEGAGPVVLVDDNDWSSARNRTARIDEMKIVIERAESADRKIIVVQTAPSQEKGAVSVSAPLTGAEARQMLLESKPQPWPADRAATARALDGLDLPGDTSVFWLSNGLNDDGALTLAQKLQQFGKLTVVQDSGTGARLLVPATMSPDEPVAVIIRRADGQKDDIATLIASDDNGNAMQQVQVTLKAGETETRAEFTLTPEQRAQLLRVSIDGDNSAGAVVLMDERWRRRPVGVLSYPQGENEQSFLNDVSYVDRALSPHVDLRKGSLNELIGPDLAVLIMTDSASYRNSGDDFERIKSWVQQGGTLLRFAGPALSLSGPLVNDELLPVELHSLPRANHDVKNVHPAPFDAKSPFRDIPVASDVIIKRRVLAKPSSELEERIWARFDDGMPMVTAKREGDGWIVLVHTSAGPEWGNLQLSGMFGDMMRAVVAHSRGVTNDSRFSDLDMPAIQTLDGRGSLIYPPSSVKPLTRQAINENRIGPQNPPGLYGNESIRHALNIAAAVPEMKSFPALPEGARAAVYSTDRGINDLSGPILAGAMSLLLIDLLVLMGQRGMLPRVRRTPQPPSSPKP